MGWRADRRRRQKCGGAVYLRWLGGGIYRILTAFSRVRPLRQRLQSTSSVGSPPCPYNDPSDIRNSASSRKSMPQRRPPSEPLLHGRKHTIVDVHAQGLKTSTRRIYGAGAEARITIQSAAVPLWRDKKINVIDPRPRRLTMKSTLACGYSTARSSCSTVAASSRSETNWRWPQYRSPPLLCEQDGPQRREFHRCVDMIRSAWVPPPCPCRSRCSEDNFKA